jgi:hypothetical protein
MAVKQVYNNFFIGTRAEMALTGNTGTGNATMSSGCVYLAEDFREFYGVDLSGNTFFIGGALSISGYTIADIIGLEDALNYKLESVSGFTTNNSVLRVDGSGRVTQESLVIIDDLGSIDIPSGQTYSVGGIAIESDKTYKHIQSIVSDIWNIPHPLKKEPSCMIFDGLGNELVGRIAFIDNDNVQITFNTAFSGSTILN